MVSHVGIYDMLRVELSPNGAFNVTEFGTVKDPEQFKALYAYSPYHHVKDGATYPRRAVPDRRQRSARRSEQSRKMTARLQAAEGARAAAHERVRGPRHLARRCQIIEQDVDVYAFLFDTLGLEYKAHGPSTR